MKKITLLLVFIVTTSLAQVKGNGNIKTKSFPIENIKNIKINFYAHVTIDASVEESLTITTDSNMFELIEKEVVDGTLYLDQKEWISPSKTSKIIIGAPNINRVEQGTHDITTIINIDNDELRVNAPIGKVFIEGKTKELRISSEGSKIDATKLLAEKAYVNLWSWGTVKVNVTDMLWADVSNKGKLFYVSKPEKLDIKTKHDGKVLSLNNIEKIKNPEAKYINFKIKNNSANRNHFEVVGPKQDGSKFGYGFPMMPFAIRKETWTVGTKVYKTNKLGVKKLLITIKPEDENMVVKLF